MTRAGRFWFFVVCLVVCAAAGCSGEAPTETRSARELGEALFDDRGLSTSGFNVFSCSTCHSVEQPESNPYLAGFSLADSAHRSSWWNGYVTQYLDAVNVCLVFFMRGEPIEPGDPEGDALYEFLSSISPTNPAAAIQYTVVKNAPSLAGGDPDHGRVVYDAACQSCHGNKGSGHGRLNSSVTILGPDLSDYYDQEFPGIDHGLILSEKVRHGQFFGIGGNMPFFALERLSDDDLADLTAYLDL